MMIGQIPSLSADTHHLSGRLLLSTVVLLASAPEVAGQAFLRD
jgi:hypothetical protein